MDNFVLFVKFSLGFPCNCYQQKVLACELFNINSGTEASLLTSAEISLADSLYSSVTDAFSDHRLYFVLAPKRQLQHKSRKTLREKGS